MEIGNDSHSAKIITVTKFGIRVFFQVRMHVRGSANYG